MQRRTEQLHTGRSQKLRHADPADGPFHLLRYRQQRRNERWKIERRENRERVPHGKERIAGCRNRPRHRAGDARPGAKHARELAVFVEAEGHVDAGGSEEFRRAGRGGFGRGVGDCAADGVDAVGCGVGAEVEG